MRNVAISGIDQVTNLLLKAKDENNTEMFGWILQHVEFIDTSLPKNDSDYRSDISYDSDEADSLMDIYTIKPRGHDNYYLGNRDELKELATWAMSCSDRHLLLMLITISTDCLISTIRIAVKRDDIDLMKDIIRFTPNNYKKLYGSDEHVSTAIVINLIMACVADFSGSGLMKQLLDFIYGDLELAAYNIPGYIYHKAVRSCDIDMIKVILTHGEDPDPRRFAEYRKVLDTPVANVRPFTELLDLEPSEPAPLI